MKFEHVHIKRYLIDVAAKKTKNISYKYYTKILKNLYLNICMQIMADYSAERSGPINQKGKQTYKIKIYLCYRRAFFIP